MYVFVYEQPGCKFLYVMTRYSRGTNFLWMFCEGLYLHRLIVKAFTPPKRLLVFYILGWGEYWALHDLT